MWGFIISLLSSLIPMLFYAGILYWLDRYEKEPLKMLLGVFLWGSFVAALGAFIINSMAGLSIFFFTQSENISQLTVTVFVAPFVEEGLKGLAVLLVLLFFYSEYNSILVGIIYAGITALGFAASENMFYTYHYGYLEGGWPGLYEVFALRTLQLGWTHPFYTSFIGMGLAVARMSNKASKRILAPLTGLGLAISTHTIHNGIVVLLSGSQGRIIRLLWDWVGWFIVIGIIIWAISREKRNIQVHLHPEIEREIITYSQYKTASSAWQQWIAKLNALPQGRFRETHRFYQLCGELSHLKQHRIQSDERREISGRITTLRKQLANLSVEIQG